MARFRKKPVVVTAEQWYPGRKIPGVCFCREANSSEPVPHIHTLEGIVFVQPGDWIITGVKGEKYPCKPDVFQDSYESLPDEEGD